MELVLPPIYLFDKYGDAKRERLAEEKVENSAKEERRLFCASCRNAITSQDDRISVQGGQEHTFTNPHGYMFHIGCFHHSRGCAHVGDATSAWSWFRGFTWRIALCANCNAHLGWLFQAPDEQFHGLILNRLTSVH
ncbi:MAG: cereblon family protein [Acidiferrobacterales bacterium]